VIAISTTGQLPELLAAVDTARAAGADVIAITSSKSALARRASICLAVDHSEDSTTFLSMISRILQLLLIDIMAVGISLGPQGEAAGEGDSERRRLLISHLDI
jgi:glucokinase